MLDTYFKQYFWTFHLVILAVAAILVAKSASAFIGQALRPSPQTLTEGASRPVAVRPESDEGRIASSAFLERNVFGAEREDLKPVAPDDKGSENVDTANCDRSSMRATLVGTVVHTDPVHSIAIFQDTSKNEPEAYRAGDKLLEEATVLSIEWRRVEIDHGGRCEFFSLDDDTDGSKESLASAMPPPPPPPGGEDSSAPPDLKLGDAVKKTGASEYEVPRGEIDSIMTNLPVVATQARIVPSFKDGKPNGFKLFSIRPGSLYSKIGIQNGDIIQKINGYDMSSPDKALEVYSKLKDASTVTVDLIRRGKTETVTYNIR